LVVRWRRMALRTSAIVKGLTVRWVTQER
jgi:hypothetical protein